MPVRLDFKSRNMALTDMSDEAASNASSLISDDGVPPSSIPHQRRALPAAAPPFPSCSSRTLRPESQAQTAKATIKPPRPASNVSSDASLLRPAGLPQPRPDPPPPPVQHQPGQDASSGRWRPSPALSQISSDQLRPAGNFHSRLPENTSSGPPGLTQPTHLHTVSPPEPPPALGEMCHQTTSSTPQGPPAPHFTTGAPRSCPKSAAALAHCWVQGSGI
ncbi:hypothetical protein NDU88_004455 [Pleurodeles waltl]|uniref:Uncharacterized protein n=1 Tax=Pleurodeles waltl TaxID=8319 RepID=A0AAV7L4T4_PLEWA|nr:hypothetical protein NDU88_004455 [Pleurodeles waltl]